MIDWKDVWYMMLIIIIFIIVSPTLVKMTEDFLQFVWKHQLFEKNELYLSTGEAFEIVYPGQWNNDAGPDFANAKIKIDNTLWCGNIEIHLRASDWYRHQHQHDKNYNNVILHVVHLADMEIELERGGTLPSFVIEPSPAYWNRYESLLAESQDPACYRHLPTVDEIFIRVTIDKMLVERLENKIEKMKSILVETGNDWNETFYRKLAINFGFKTNALPFEMLARSLPLSIVSHHKNSLYQLEALFFGQSGLLNEQLLGDSYFIELREEFSYLSKKYKLKGIEGHLWKFMRMRPANFPSIRIAQLCRLLNQSTFLLSKILETDSPQNIINLFDVQASSYWDNHYRFNHKSSNQPKRIGEKTKQNIIINTVVPFLYLYGEHHSKPNLKQKALNLLELLPAEKNSIIDRWAELGIKSSNAYDSQGLIQLKNVYCDNKICLKCQIGNKVIVK